MFNKTKISLIALVFSVIMVFMFVFGCIQVYASTSTSFTDANGTMLTFEIPDITDLDGYSLGNHLIFYDNQGYIRLFLYDRVNGNETPCLWQDGNNWCFNGMQTAEVYILSSGSSEWHHVWSPRNSYDSAGVVTVLYSTVDIYKNDSLFFHQLRCQPLALGLTAEMIAVPLMTETIGLVPLVIGLVILAISLWKGLASLWTLLRTRL